MDQLMKNREAYNLMRDELENNHLGRIALFHNGELIRVYNDRDDAYDIGLDSYGEGNFSIKRIGSPSLSLGAATMYLKPIALGQSYMPTFRGNIVNGQIILVTRIANIANEDERKPSAFNALVDTGAQLSAISNRVVEELSLHSDSWTTVTGVHGSEDVSVYTVRIGIPITEEIVSSTGASSRRTFTRSQNRIEVSLMGFEDPNFDVLLGMDFLYEYHLNIFAGQFILSN